MCALYITPQQPTQISPLEKVIPNAINLFGKYYADSSLARDEYRHEMSLKGFGLLNTDEEEITDTTLEMLKEGKAVRDAYDNVWSLPFKKEPAGPKKDYRLFVREDENEEKHYQHFKKDEDVPEGKGWSPHEKGAKKDYDLFEQRDDKGKVVQQKYFEKKEGPIEEGWLKVAGKGVTATASAIMSAPTKTKLEVEGVLNPTKGIGTYRSVMLGFKPEYFEHMGKLKAMAGKQLGKFGVDAGEGGWSNWVEFEAERAAYIAEVMRSFDQYRKDITGAQASYQEIQYLMQNIPTKDDSPQAFMRKLKNFLVAMARIRKRSRAMLERGMKAKRHEVDDEGNIIQDSKIDALYSDDPVELIDLTKEELGNLFKGAFKTDEEMLSDPTIKALFPNLKGGKNKTINDAANEYLGD